MLEVILRQLKSVNVIEAVIVVGYLKDKIIDYFGDGRQLGMRIEYVVQEKITGSAHAVLAAERFFRDEKFLCIAADSLFETEQLSRLLSVKSDGALSVHTVDDGRSYGVILRNGKYVKDVIEKSPEPPSNLANTSVYLLPHAVFPACEEIAPGAGGEYQIVDAIRLLIKKGLWFEYVPVETWIDVGTHERYEEAKEVVKKVIGLSMNKPQSAMIVSNIGNPSVL